MSTNLIFSGALLIAALVCVCASVNFYIRAENKDRFVRSGVEADSEGAGKWEPVPLTGIKIKGMEMKGVSGLKINGNAITPSLECAICGKDFVAGDTIKTDSVLQKSHGANAWAHSECLKQLKEAK